MQYDIKVVILPECSINEKINRVMIILEVGKITANFLRLEDPCFLSLSK